MAHPYARHLAYALDPNFSNTLDLRVIWSDAERLLDKTLEALRDTGVTIKGNSMFRLLGGTSLLTVAEAGCEIFADLKLFDVQGTIANDASWLCRVPNLKILTVAEMVHPKVFSNLATSQLKGILIAPVNPLTDLTDVEFARRGEISREHATTAFFKRVLELPARGIICSPKDIAGFPRNPAEMRRFITPGIRPSWVPMSSSDTNKVNALTHQEAIRAGADILVVGSPLRYNGDLRGNTLRMLDEIGKAHQQMQRG